VSAEFRGRFDHAVILVADLGGASASFTKLGFSVSPGGAHTGLGTHNALVRFGLDYLELLAVRDEQEALRARSSTSSIVERLRSGQSGLASFALATVDIDRDAARFREQGLPAVGPFAMERLRPDGRRLSWRLLVPEGDSWGRPWPFFIQWDQPDETRLSWERPGTHANGARCVVAVSVAVADLDAAAVLYERTLGLRASGAEDVASLGARRRTFTTDGFAVHLYGAHGRGWLADRLRTDGEGIFEIALATPSREATMSTLERAGIGADRTSASVVVPAHAAQGARITFVSDGP
jgi:catechol 2,3-dioxygenase-like lactoylglutathione lyase family enzyme